MKKIGLMSAIIAALAALAGCGGQDGQPTQHETGQTRLLADTAVTTGSYEALVQQLYISYFGRPADVGGLQNFRSQLAALNAPLDLDSLTQAYQKNPAIRALIDSFGLSAESAALYSGDNRQFVTAMYQNVLNRAPDAEGLQFWTEALNKGSVTRANASLSLMAGALSNTTAQGKIDAALIGKKVQLGSEFTKALLSAPVNGYSGYAAAHKARSMLANVTATTSPTDFGRAVSSLIAELAAPAVPLDQLSGTWLGVTNADTFPADHSQLAVSVASNILTIRAAQFYGSTCLFSAPLTADRGGVEQGAYQCSDSSKGTWRLVDMKTVDKEDIAIRLVMDGNRERRFFGMSRNGNTSAQAVAASLIQQAAGNYVGIAAVGGPIPVESTNTTVSLAGTSLTITLKSFFSGTCDYVATLAGDGQTIKGNYACSDSTRGSWSLLDFRQVGTRDVYLSILQDDKLHRAYGMR